MEKSLKSSSLNYGLMLALILIACSIIGYAVSLKLFVSTWFPLVITLVIIVVGIMSSLKAKKLLGGYISFKDTFTAYFIAIVTGLFLAAVFNYVLLNFIDAEAGSILRDYSIEAQLAGMEKWGTPQETLDKQRINLEKEPNFFSAKLMGIGLAFKIIGYSIIGLISSLIIRRKDPNLA